MRIRDEVGRLRANRSFYGQFKISFSRDTSDVVSKWQRSIRNGWATDEDFAYRIGEFERHWRPICKSARIVIQFRQSQDVLENYFDRRFPPTNVNVERAWDLLS